MPQESLNVDNWKKGNVTHLLEHTIIDIFVEKVNSHAIVKKKKKKSNREIVHFAQFSPVVMSSKITIRILALIQSNELKFPRSY